MSQPLVSCITPTYGRTHLLQEMYWCWLNQTYPNKELIIVNDEPNMTIVCDDDRVKIFNFPKRFSGLGAKRNFAVEQVSSDAEFILPFDDDDLTLPNHIETLVTGFDEAPSNINRCKNFRHIITKDNTFKGIMEGNFPFFGASCFRASIMKSLKFEDNYVMGEDVQWMDTNGIIPHIISYSKPTFIYRQGMGVVHASGHKIKSSSAEAQKELHDKITSSAALSAVPIEFHLKGKLMNSSRILYNEILQKHL